MDRARRLCAVLERAGRAHERASLLELRAARLFERRHQIDASQRHRQAARLQALRAEQTFRQSSKTIEMPGEAGGEARWPRTRAYRRPARGIPQAKDQWPSMSANFRVGIEQLGPDVTRIVFAGDIDLRAEPELKQLADSALDSDLKVLVDLSGADFIDSTILSFVLDGAKRVNQRSGRFVVLCPDAGMRKLFEIAGLNLIVPVVDTLERALAHLGTASWSSRHV